MARSLTLILGGARSGKSDYAESLAAQNAAADGGGVLYVATAQAWDDEMAARIAQHRAARPSTWRTLEAHRAVGPALDRALSAEPAAVVLLDCMTLLTSNVLLDVTTDAEDAADAEGESSDSPIGSGEAGEAAVHAEIDGLLAAYTAHDARWIVVSNEVGLGIVPAYVLGRVYRDVLGRVNRRLAAAADRVLFMVAGLPMTLKDE